MIKWIVCAALVWMVGCSNDAPSRKVTQMDADAPKVEPSSKAIALEKAVPADFEVLETYGGRIYLPMSGEAVSKVIRSQAELDVFIKSVPKFKIQKGPGDEPNPDPLLTTAPVDFEKHMIVAAACATFYCDVSIEGHVKEGDTTIILMQPGGEPEGSEFAQRPIGEGSVDSVGNYSGIKVAKIEGEVLFRTLP